MREKLRHPDGTFAYFRHPDGTLEERREALGTALAVLVGVVEGEKAKAAVESFPISDAGAPLFVPFWAWEHTYHNNSSWPFTDAFLLKAREKSLGIDETGRFLTLMARTCRNDLTFAEVVNFHTRQPYGSSACLWTASAFLGRCLEAGYVDAFAMDDEPRAVPACGA
jgi:hypothetical protein